MFRGPQSSIKVDQTKRRRQIAKDLLLWTSARNGLLPARRETRGEMQCGQQACEFQLNDTVEITYYVASSRCISERAYPPRYVQYRQSRPDANSLVDTATKKSDDGQTTCSTEYLHHSRDFPFSWIQCPWYRIRDLPVNNQHAVHVCDTAKRGLLCGVGLGWGWGVHDSWRCVKCLDHACRRDSKLPGSDARKKLY